LGPDSTPARIKPCEEKWFYFISDISYVSYNIRLTKKGQLATFLYPRLAHKEATGNSAYFFEYKPHLTYSFKVACPSKEQVHEERVEVVLSSDQTFGRNVVQTFRQFFPHNVQKYRFDIKNKSFGCKLTSVTL